MLIHLTQPYSTCSVDGRGKLPANAVGVGGTVLDRRGMPGVPVCLAMALRVCLPSLRWAAGLAHAPWLVGLPDLSLPGFGYCRDDLSGLSAVSDALVPGHLVCDQPEERGQCLGGSTGSGAGQLPDGMGMVAQTAASDGSAGSGSPQRDGRSRRNLLGSHQNQRLLLGQTRFEELFMC